MDITQLLAFSVKNKASDLHLSAGLPPMIRVHGDVRRINVDALDHKTVHGMIFDLMNDSQRKQYEEMLECDFSFEIEGLARFRVNAFNQQRGAGAVFRTIPSKILTLEQLNAPLISDLIFKGEVSEIKEVMKKNTNTGMQTFDHALFTLFDNGVISYEDALRNADSVNDLRLQIKLNAKRAKVSDLSAGTESLSIAD